MKSWPMVRLGEVTRHRSEFIEIEPELEYKRCRVQTGAKGIVLRDVVTGSQISTKTQQVCRTGEFLVAEIDAKLGGYGLVPDDLDGAIVSSHYFLFQIDEARLNPRFLEYYAKTPAFHMQVVARGSTNYAAVRSAHVLEYRIPLPSLHEQRQVVMQLDRIAGLAEEATRLLSQAAADSLQVCRNMLIGPVATHLPRVRVGDLVQQRPTDVIVEPDQTYHFAGVYSFGRGVFRGEAKLGSEFAYKELTRLRAGNFTYPKLMAWEGALGVVPPECDGLVVSPEFPVFEIDRDRVLPDVLDVYFRDPRIWPALKGDSPGTNVRRRRLNPGTFLNLTIPLPPMEEQRRLATMRARLQAAAAHRRLVLADLDALLPAVLRRAFAGMLHADDVLASADSRPAA